MNRVDDGNKAYSDLLNDSRIAQAAEDLVNYQWGEALLEKTSYDQAIERYTAVIKWPRSNQSLVTLAHLHSGMALDSLGKRVEAVAQYQLVLKRENVYDSYKLATEYVKKPYVPARS
jgi:tetratricopeptide (TPR) repeat protein